VRDATATNLATALDFDQVDLNAPRMTVPSGPFGVPCPPEGAAHGALWDVLRGLLPHVGWPGLP
jgi:hypothetical protein